MSTPPPHTTLPDLIRRRALLSLAAGAAIPALFAGAGVLWGPRSFNNLVVNVVASAAAIALAVTCWHWRWKPERYIPTQADVTAGYRLVKRLAAVQGEVWMPSHPWYLVLAGKHPYVHRMGVKDVTWRQSRTVLGLDDALKTHKFAALVFDNRDLFLELPQLRTYYQPGLKIPGDERPRLYTGAKIVPESIWVPAVSATPAAGARVVVDLEQRTWQGWTPSGSAWGEGPGR